MLKIEFQNAVATDNGFGLGVNGKSLEEIISTALGTRVGDKRAGYGDNIDLLPFASNCCNIIVIIDPQSVKESIEDDDGVWNSVKEMEDDILELYQQKNAEAESKE